MAFEIPCAIFARLSHASLRAGEVRPFTKELRPYLQCVRIEHRAGRRLAVACNNGILAVEVLGETTDPDGALNIKTSDALLAACRNEGLLLGSILTAANFSVRTTLGFSEFQLGVDQNYVDWHASVPLKIATHATGAMTIDADDIYRLAMSAPSHRIVTPKFFDHKKPTIVRDDGDPNWFGMFMASELEGEPIKPADLPDWLRFDPLYEIPVKA